MVFRAPHCNIKSYYFRYWGGDHFPSIIKALDICGIGQAIDVCGTIETFALLTAKTFPRKFTSTGKSFTNFSTRGGGGLKQGCVKHMSELDGSVVELGLHLQSHNLYDCGFNSCLPQLNRSNEIWMAPIIQSDVPLSHWPWLLLKYYD